jgi:hypothetical protein
MGDKLCFSGCKSSYVCWSCGMARVGQGAFCRYTEVTIRSTVADAVRALWEQVGGGGGG